MFCEANKIAPMLRLHGCKPAQWSALHWRYEGLNRRAYEHRKGLGSGLSTKYGCKRLVWYETHSDIREVIIREKRPKKWNRSWKIGLIEKASREWADLYDAIAV